MLITETEGPGNLQNVCCFICKNSISFELQNNSTSEVEVLYASQQCDCTSVRIPRGRISPGKSVKGFVDWDTSGRERHTESLITVYGKKREEPDAVQIVANIVLRADVIPDYTLSCESLEFKKGVQKREAIHLLPKNDINVTIIRASSNHKAFKVSIINDKQLSIEYTPSVSVIDSNALFITIETTNKNYTSLRIPIVLNE